MTEITLAAMTLAFDILVCGYYLNSHFAWCCFLTTRL